MFPSQNYAGNRYKLIHKWSHQPQDSLNIRFNAVNSLHLKALNRQWCNGTSFHLMLQLSSDKHTESSPLPSPCLMTRQNIKNKNKVRQISPLLQLKQWFHLCNRSAECFLKRIRTSKHLCSLPVKNAWANTPYLFINFNKVVRLTESSSSVWGTVYF